jgi:hypothetical protein
MVLMYACGTIRKAYDSPTHVTVRHFIYILYAPTFYVLAKVMYVGNRIDTPCLDVALC